jgi:hypothetical protein
MKSIGPRQPTHNGDLVGVHRGTRGACEEGPRYQRIAHIKKLLTEGVLDANFRRTRPLRGEDGPFAIAAKL